MAPPPGTPEPPRRSSMPLPGLNTTASSLRARRSNTSAAAGAASPAALSAGGSSLRRVVGTHSASDDDDDDEDDDDEEEEAHDTLGHQALIDLQAGLIMPGVSVAARPNPAAAAARPPLLPGAPAASSGGSAALARARQPLNPIARRAAGQQAAPLRPAGAAAARPQASAKPPPPQSRFKGTPARSTRYSLPVRAEKPVRTSKTSGKHVLLPSESQLAPLPGDEEEEEEDEESESESAEDDVAAAASTPSPTRPIPVGVRPAPSAAAPRGPVHARAPPRVPKASGPAYHTFERLAPQSRQHTPLPRLTSYAIGPSIHLPTLVGFLRREHGVRPRLYDECAYVVYFKPLLPGFGRAEVRSAPEPRSGSPGAESRRERELEGIEESGYVGSVSDTLGSAPAGVLTPPPTQYFAASKDEEEDPHGYIHGGEGQSEGQQGKEASTTDRERRELSEHIARVSSRPTSPQPSSNGAAATELASSPEGHRRLSSDEEGATTPRALQPIRMHDEPDEDALGSLDAAMLGSSLGAASASSEEMAPSSSRARRGSGGMLTDDELLSADEAGARDMLIQQYELENGGSDLAQAAPPGGVEDGSIMLDAASPPSAAPRSWEESSAPAPRGGGGGTRRARKGRRSTGPNMASHNHDTSANMLTSRSILEAMQQAELIILPYGVLVMYNLSAADERSIIRDVLSSGCVRGGAPLGEEEEETEAFHYCYDPTVPAPRIFNDFFTFRAPNHLLKLSLAHAIAQSTKLSVFEESMQRTLELTSHIPKELASSGELKLKRREALRLTGRIFKLRVDVNLTSNLLDTPELFWSEASLKALYDAIREYLEIDERVENLNERLAVCSSLSDLLHETLSNAAMSKM
jgi:uncharacterized Rmd1/YagE family protein